MTRERALELANATRVNAFGEHSSSAIADAILAAVAEERTVWRNEQIARVARSVGCKRCQGLRYINPAPFDKCLPCPDCTADADGILCAIEEERNGRPNPQDLQQMPEQLGLSTRGRITEQMWKAACPNCQAIPPNKHAWGCPVAQPLDVVVR